MTQAPITPIRAGGPDDAPDLVFLHGFGGDRLVWAMTTHSFAKDRRLWVVELPGHGANVAHPAASPADMAQAIAAGLTDLRAPCAVVGHSLGGAVSLELARIRPDLVTHLVLLAPLGLGTGVNPAFLDAYPGLSDPETAQQALHLAVARPRLISPMMVGHVLNTLRDDSYRAALRQIATQIRDYGSATVPPGPKTTVIWGAEDQINPIDRARVDQLDLDLHLLADTGHLPQLEANQTVNRLIQGAITG